jgi:hypothetical protein
MDWSFGLILGAGPVALSSGLGHLNLSCGLVRWRGLWSSPDGWSCHAGHVAGPVDWSYELVLWTIRVFWSFGLVQGTCVRRVLWVVLWTGLRGNLTG